ncbi:MAG: pyridoxamine kinase [Eubacteriales bacterium]|nr:pyridoxamine kinase [Eubacteriales bacterium]
MKRILTIQDISCVGQCSLTVALPIISACGVETAILPSSVLSTHTGGFTGFTFHDLTEDMPAIEAHWNKEHLTFDAFYTGYVSPSQIDYIRHIMESCAAPGALRIVDPAMADNGVLYVGFESDFPSQMARLCEGADYILPNLTEAAFLLGRTPVLSGYDKSFIEELCKALQDTLHVKNVILTGVSFDENQLGAAIYDGTGFSYVMNPKISRMSHGTGDIFASAFTGALVRGKSAKEAAAIAADFVCASIQATAEDHRYGVSFEAAIPSLVKALAE